MFTFLVATGLRDTRALRRAASITKTIMPTLDRSTSTSVVEWPSLSGGYFLLRPDIPFRFLSTAEGRTISIIVFGQVLGCDDPAEHILATWTGEASCDAVRQLEGSFSAVVTDLATGTIFVLSDRLGCRTLRYFTHGSSFLLSSHDVPIVATGLCPLNYDLASCASALALDWSLNGRPLLTHVSRCDSRSVLKWNGEISHRRQPLIAVDARVQETDRVGIRKQVDSVLDALRTRLADVTRGEELVEAELTAGQDSRAGLGLLLSQYPSSKVETRTSGESRNIDVRTARRIADAYGLRHRRDEPAELSAEELASNSEVYAFFWNGDTSAKRAFQRFPPLEPSTPLRLTGSGGEIYRGYYYPLRAGARGQYRRRDAKVDLERFARRRDIPWADASLIRCVVERIGGVIDEYGEITDNGYDVLDLFYLHERYSRWTPTSNSPFALRTVDYFGGAAAAARVFRLPAPVASHCPIHRLAIATHLRRTYWWPINGRYILPFEDIPLLTALGKRIDRSLQNRRVGAKSHETRRSELLRGQMDGPIGHLLTRPNSFGRLVLAAGAIERIVSKHRTGERDALQMLGILITMETWKAQIERAKELAADAGSDS